MRTLIYVLSLVGLAGCSSSPPSTSNSSYETLANACVASNASTCFKAAEFVWKMRPSDLKPCESAGKSFCVKNGESPKQASNRLKDKAIEQHALSCESLNNADACLRAGSGLAIKGIDMPASNYKPIANRAEKFFNRACDLGSKLGCKFRGSTRRAGS